MGKIPGRWYCPHCSENFHDFWALGDHEAICSKRPASISDPNTAIQLPETD